MTRQKKLTVAGVAGAVVIAGAAIGTTVAMAAGPGGPGGPGGPFGMHGRPFGGPFASGGIDPGWGFGLHLAFMLVALLLVLATVVWVVRRLTHNRVVRPASAAALTELDVLYARGGVTREEYLLRRADLLGAPTSPPPAA